MNFILYIVTVAFPLYCQCQNKNRLTFHSYTEQEEFTTKKENNVFLAIFAVCWFSCLRFYNFSFISLGAFSSSYIFPSIFSFPFVPVSCSTYFLASCLVDIKQRGETKWKRTQTHTISSLRSASFVFLHIYMCIIFVLYQCCFFFCFVFGADLILL